MDLDTGGLRERKKQETRVALSWAAIRLTVERGLDNVRVEDIAAAAGVSTRTFSNYFGSKGEAIAARQYDRSRAIAAALRERPAGEPLWEAVTHAVLTGFALGEQGQGRAPDQAWIEGVRLMVAEPALQGEMHKAVTAGRPSSPSPSPNAPAPTPPRTSTRSWWRPWSGPRTTS